jgi:hypothetical protein
MIRKSMPSGDGPMDEHRFSRSQQTRTRACAEIVLNNKLERDGDSS